MTVTTPESRAHDYAWNVLASIFTTDFERWNEWQWSQYYATYKLRLNDTRREIAEHRYNEAHGGGI